MQGMSNYDLVFVGHVTIDEIVAKEGSARATPGGAPLFGVSAALCLHKKLAIVTRMAEEDFHLLDPLKTAGVDIYLQHTQETTHMRVVHPTGNVDERWMYQTKDAGFFLIDEMPPIEPPCLIHCGALTDREFTLDFMRGLKERSFRLSVDMQSFVRQVDAETRMIRFMDVVGKKSIVGVVDFVKLDVVEAAILTGTDDLESAATITEDWGSRETVITSARGVLVRSEGKTYFEKFSNRSSQGRTGRGDTTFGAYLARRLDHPIEESLQFAVALASIKMESPDPFRGTIEDVLERMRLVGN